ncbi:MAG: helix-turn-helix domain-containing protein [Lachnospiraceae bacterium]|nr:helix-turn-helix domain-containing protein [Lachnospiraceae bacterium]MDE6254173.1 helix-turn-helix domain-containing protein [Lachnospiraceae bacterium]
MSRKRIYSPEQIINICEDYLSGLKSSSQLCIENGLSKGKPPGTFWKWIAQYRKNGADAFRIKSGNSSYPSEFKTMVVEEYINGYGSMNELCAKYKISSESTLKNWILLYNANRELKDYCPKREVYMADARRKTTFDERKEIVAYCIHNNRDYKNTAAKYDVSYSQVYSWVRKYDMNGESGLADKRGRHKTDDEVDELERLRRENLRLKRQLEERDMAVELLKKVKEFERM